MSRRFSLVAVIISAACFGTLAVLTPLAYASGAEPLPLDPPSPPPPRHHWIAWLLLPERIDDR